MLAVYCRISRDRENQKSIKEQQIIGIDYAKEHGLEYELYIDKGISGGGNTSKRPAFEKMLTDIEAGKITDVYVWNQDRTAREEVTWFNLANSLIEGKINLIENGKIIDLEDPNIYFMRGISSMMDAKFRRDTSNKIKDVVKRNLSEGRVHGRVPYGYKKDKDHKMVVDPEEAKVVDQIFHMSLNGMGYRTIADKLNEQGVPTRFQILMEKDPEGRKKVYKSTNRYTKQTELKDKDKTEWVHSTIRGIIKNTTYMGKKVSGGMTYDAPIIIDPEFFNKVQKHLKKNMNNSGKKVDYKYLLNDLCYCGECSSRYRGRISKRKGKKDVTIYRCATKKYKAGVCSNRDIQIPELDYLIWERLFKGQKMREAITEHFNAQKTDDEVNGLKEAHSRLKATIADLKRKKENVIDLGIDGTISREDVKERVDSFNSQIDELRDKASKIQDTIDYHIENKERAMDIDTELKRIKAHTPFNDKQEIIQKYIKSISILFKDNHFHIQIEYHLDIPNEQFVVDKLYNVAIEQRGSIIIPLSDEYKKMLGTDRPFTWSSKIEFNPVVNRAIRTSLQFDERQFFTSSNIKISN